MDQTGAVVGTHRGIGAYTVGQRKGLGIAAAEPLFVHRIDAERNLVSVGPERLLYSQEVTAEEVHCTSVDTITPGREVQVKVRSRAEPVPATVLSCAGDQLRVRFGRPQRAVTPGQALVLYDGDLVLGGGTISAAA